GEGFLAVRGRRGMGFRYPSPPAPLGRSPPGKRGERPGEGRVTAAETLAADGSGIDVLWRHQPGADVRLDQGRVTLVGWAIAAATGDVEHQALVRAGQGDLPRTDLLGRQAPAVDQNLSQRAVLAAAQATRREAQSIRVDEEGDRGWVAGEHTHLKPVAAGTPPRRPAGRPPPQVSGVSQHR